MGRGSVQDTDQSRTASRLNGAWKRCLTGLDPDWNLWSYYARRNHATRVLNLPALPRPIPRDAFLCTFRGGSRTQSGSHTSQTTRASVSAKLLLSAYLAGCGKRKGKRVRISKRPVLIKGSRAPWMASFILLRFVSHRRQFLGQHKLCRLEVRREAGPDISWTS